MINTLAPVGTCWQPSSKQAGAASSAAERPAGAAAAPTLASRRGAAAASAHTWADAMPQVHGTGLPVAVVRLRGYSFAIRPRGTPPV